MSRFTSKVSYTRPSVVDLLSSRPTPLSPPETDPEPGSVLHEDIQPAREDSADASVPRVRKSSSVAYNNSGLVHREPRSIPRQQRWLVMVLPPPSLTREPPLLGHTLSSAPADRFSNGILMPLFPTLYGQLTAIAREFNMPSTTGLCVYLRFQDTTNSMMTPRISDESWQILWSSFLVGDERTIPLPSHGLPISGRIEFDIDLRRAKWFNTWMGHAKRESAESESLTREPSVGPTHWRGDSTTSFFPTEQLVEDPPSLPDTTRAMTMMPSRTASRHAPRPLLLERRDTSSVHSFSKHPSRAPSVSYEHPPSHPIVQHPSVLPAEPTFVPSELTPKVQEQDEPQTAKRAELHTLVHQWRQSAISGPASGALAASGQSSLDPVNMPAGTDVELDLNDFAWSVSSAGPPLDTPLSPHWPERPPSVHLQGRLEGSVCLTPSVCTSAGPEYDWPQSPVSCVSRRPSPDLGMRMVDYVCLTPTTATSWGPDDLPSPRSVYESQYRASSVDLGMREMGSRPATPSTATSWGPDNLPSPPPSDYESEYRAPSVDIGMREMGSRPVTPSTATSWGRDDVLSPSPSECESQYWAPSIDVGMRAMGSRPVTPSTATSWGPDELLSPTFSNYQSRAPSVDLCVRCMGSRPVTPSTATSWGPLDSPSSYPDSPDYVRTPDAGDRGFIDRDKSAQNARAPVYPYCSAWTAQPWDHVWPYQTHTRTTSVEEIEHSPPAPRGRSGTSLPEWPDFAALYPSDPSTERSAANKSQPVDLPTSAGYPHFELYKPVYPHNLDCIYPVKENQESNVRPTTRPTWRHVWPYQTHTRKTGGGEVESPKVESLIPIQVSHRQDGGLLPEWPDFAALYPSDPAMERSAANKSQPVALSTPAGYPHLELYKPVYPHNLDSIYPAQQQRDPLVGRSAANKSQPVTLSTAAGYPHLELYKPVYPHNLDYIYPVQQQQHRPSIVALSAPEPRKLLPEWPDFAALYPSDSGSERAAANKSLPVYLPKSIDYPFFNLYPKVYPYHLDEIYPTILQSQLENVAEASSAPSTGRRHLLPEWPDFAALYPIDSTMEEVAVNKSQPVQLPRSTGYPLLEIYPRAYPYSLEIYPPAPSLNQAEPMGQKESRFKLHASGIQAKELLPEWPDFAALYPADPAMEQAANNKSQSVHLPRAIDYPFLDIYPSAYPYNLDQIYPTTAASLILRETIDRQESTSQIRGRGTQAKRLLPEWPDFASLYPVDPTVERAGANKSQSVTLARREGYPSIVPYPAVYPYTLREIYPNLQPTLHLDVRATNSMVQQPLLEYPDFAGLYPSDPLTDRVGGNKSQPVSLKSAGYPSLTIYSPVYSFNLSEIYGPSRTINASVEEVHSNETISIRLPVYSGYPNFNLYPAPQGYPTFEIYPPIRLRESTAVSPISVKLPVVYPVVEPYEPVYPHLVVYHQTQLNAVNDCLPIRPVSPPNNDAHLSRTSPSAELPDRLPPLPSNILVTTPAPSENHCAPTKSKRTHHDLHLLVFNTKSQEDSQNMEDQVPDLPSLSAPAPAVTRQRSRSGTVTSRPSTPAHEMQNPDRSTPLKPEGLSAVSARFPEVSRQPSSVSTNSDHSPPSSIHGESKPVLSSSSSDTMRLSPGRRISGLPPSPSPTGAAVVNRVRSINSQGASLTASPVTVELRGPESSKSPSDANRVRVSRNSSVLERARMFTLMEQGSEVSNAATKTHASSRSVSKLDLSKHPFA